MKKVFGLSPLVLAFVVAGCMSDGDDTIILPGTKRIYTEGEVPADVIPDIIRDEIEKYMPIYRGIDPPTINGQYLSNTIKLVGSSLRNDAIGSTNWTSMYIAFKAGENGKLAFRSKENNISQAESEDVTVQVVGTSNEFTAYFVAKGVSSDIETTQTTVISGKLTGDGITNYHYAFVMLEKGPDPDNVLVPVNTYRIFEESDGLTANYTWLTE
jgi:hypothetical protein